MNGMKPWNHEAEHPMLRLVNVVKIQSYPVGQSSFTEKVLIYEIKNQLSKLMVELSISVSKCNFYNDNENSGRLPNALDGMLCTKRFKRFVRNDMLWKEPKRFWDGTKRYVLRTKRTFWLGNETLWEQNAFSSALQGRVLLKVVNIIVDVNVNIESCLWQKVPLRYWNYVILFPYDCLYLCLTAHVESDVNLRKTYDTTFSKT